MLHLLHLYTFWQSSQTYFVMFWLLYFDINFCTKHYPFAVLGCRLADGFEWDVNILQVEDLLLYNCLLFHSVNMLFLHFTWMITSQRFLNCYVWIGWRKNSLLVPFITMIMMICLNFFKEKVISRKINLDHLGRTNSVGPERRALPSTARNKKNSLAILHCGNR